MKRIIFVFICLGAAMGGTIWFAIHHEWIIIQAPEILSLSGQAHNRKQHFSLHVWHDNHWQTDTHELILSSDASENMRILVISWLKIVNEETSSAKKITLQSALIDPTATIAYLSFDRSPFDKQASILSKLMWIKGLLKTVHANALPIQGVYFLVRHHPLTDAHLDFSHAWPTC